MRLSVSLFLVLEGCVTLFAGGSLDEIVRFAPQETVVLTATSDLVRAFVEISRRIDASNIVPNGEAVERVIVNKLALPLRQDPGTNLFGLLNGLGVREDGSAGCGLAILPEQSTPKTAWFLILPYERRDRLEELVKAVTAEVEVIEKPFEGITLVSTRSKRLCYAYTDKHIALSNSAMLVELIVQGFLGKHSTIPQPTDREGLVMCYFNPGRFVNEFIRKQKLGREGEIPAPARRAVDVLKASRGLHLTVTLTENEARLDGSFNFAEAEGLNRLLQAKPSEFSVLEYVPTDSLFWCCTNLTGEFLGIASDFFSTTFLSVPMNLVRASLGRQSAVAFLRGTIGSFPNFICVIEARDEEAGTLAFQSLQSLLLAGSKAPGKTRKIAGTNVKSFQIGVNTFYTALKNNYILLSSEEEAIRKALTTKGISVLKEVQSLVHKKQFAGVIGSVDFPGLVMSLYSARRNSTIESSRRSCFKNIERLQRLVGVYRRKFGRMPPDIETLLKALSEEKEVRRAWSYCTSDRRTRLVLDAGTGRLTCPHHGNPREPRVYVPQWLIKQIPKLNLLALLGRVIVKLELAEKGFRIRGTAHLYLKPALTPEK